MLSAPGSHAARRVCCRRACAAPAPPCAGPAPSSTVPCFPFFPTCRCCSLCTIASSRAPPHPAAPRPLHRRQAWRPWRPCWRQPGDPSQPQRRRWTRVPWINRCLSRSSSSSRRQLRRRRRLRSRRRRRLPCSPRRPAGQPQPRSSSRQRRRLQTRRRGTREAPRRRFLRPSGSAPRQAGSSSSGSSRRQQRVRRPLLQRRPRQARRRGGSRPASSLHQTPPTPPVRCPCCLRSALLLLPAATPSLFPRCHCRKPAAASLPLSEHPLCLPLAPAAAAAGKPSGSVRFNLPQSAAKAPSVGGAGDSPGASTGMHAPLLARASCLPACSLPACLPACLLLVCLPAAAQLLRRFLDDCASRRSPLQPPPLPTRRAPAAAAARLRSQRQMPGGTLWMLRRRAGGGLVCVSCVGGWVGVCGGGVWWWWCVCGGVCGGQDPPLLCRRAVRRGCPDTMQLILLCSLHTCTFHPPAWLATRLSACPPACLTGLPARVTCTAAAGPSPFLPQVRAAKAALHVGSYAQGAPRACCRMPSPPPACLLLACPASSRLPAAGLHSPPRTCLPARAAARPRCKVLAPPALPALPPLPRLGPARAYGPAGKHPPRPCWRLSLTCPALLPLLALQAAPRRAARSRRPPWAAGWGTSWRSAAAAPST